MARARTSVFCERCGAVAPVGSDSAEVRYCASCNSFVCVGCWDGESFSCTTCADEKTSGVRGGARANLTRASRAFRELESVRPELETLNAEATRGSSAALELQRRLLTIKAEDTTSAALRALEHAPRGETTGMLRQRVELERLRVAAVSSSRTPLARPRPSLPRPHLPKLPRLSRPHMPHARMPHVPRVRWPAPGLGAAWSRLRSTLGSRARMPRLRLPRWSPPTISTQPLPTISLPRLPAISLPRLSRVAPATVGTATMIVAAVLLSGIWMRTADPQLGLTSTPSVEGGVAGGRPSASPSSTSSPPPTPAPPILSRRETFDELFIGALPAEWRVLGRPASVQVAPFPDPFDRSLQIISSPEGTTSAACHQMGAVTSIALDVFSDRPPGMAVSLRDPDSGAELGVAIDTDGSVVLQPDRAALDDAVMDPGAWYLVTFEIDAAAETIAVQVGPREGLSAPDGGAIVPFEWRAADVKPELCVASQPGEAAFVDNLTTQ